MGSRNEREEGGLVAAFFMRGGRLLRDADGCG
jgi:hypothetical protein